MCNKRNQFIYKQRFYYGAVRYKTRTNPPRFAYKFGWIAKDAIGAGAMTAGSCPIRDANGNVKNVACGGP
jgi:hypothetical protein